MSWAGESWAGSLRTRGNIVLQGKQTGRGGAEGGLRFPSEAHTYYSQDTIPNRAPLSLGGLITGCELSARLAHESHSHVRRPSPSPHPGGPIRRADSEQSRSLSSVPRTQQSAQL